MEGKLDRRKVLKALAGAALLSANSESDAKQERTIRTTQANERPIESASLDTVASSLSPEEIGKDRERAVSDLLSSLPKDKHLDFLRDADRLRAESQMYALELPERVRLAKNYGDELNALLGRVHPGAHGLFALAEIGSDGKEAHRLYVLERNNSNEARFLKGYRVSMGENGFGNEPDSGKTPLGLTSIKSVHRGMYGEVVPAKPDSLKYFKTTVKGAGGRIHYFASDFGHQNIFEPAAIITDRYTIDEQRGIHFHGSNRTGRWRQQGGMRVWDSFLDAKRKSGACGRMANVDVRDLGRYIQAPDVKKGVAGTPVYIHATEEILRREKQKK